MNKMCTVPRSAPPVLSSGAPTAKSLTPSSFRSPMFATEWPKLSLFVKSGPFVVVSSIFTVESTEPSAFMKIMYT